MYGRKTLTFILIAFLNWKLFKRRKPQSIGNSIKSERRKWKCRKRGNAEKNKQTITIFVRFVQKIIENDPKAYLRTLDDLPPIIGDAFADTAVLLTVRFALDAVAGAVSAFDEVGKETKDKVELRGAVHPKYIAEPRLTEPSVRKSLREPWADEGTEPFYILHIYIYMIYI